MILISFCEENGSGHCVQHFPPRLHCCELVACGMIRRTAIGREKKAFFSEQKMCESPCCLTSVCIGAHALYMCVQVCVGRNYDRPNLTLWEV